MCRYHQVYHHRTLKIMCQSNHTYENQNEFGILFKSLSNLMVIMNYNIVVKQRLVAAKFQATSNIFKVTMLCDTKIDVMFRICDFRQVRLHTLRVKQKTNAHRCTWKRSYSHTHRFKIVHKLGQI